MTRKKSQTIPPADALLCERCGYDLAGLTREMDCPECGKAVVESLPGRERKDEIRLAGPVVGMFSNWLCFAMHPVRSWDRVSVWKTGWQDYQFSTMLLVSIVPGLSFLVISASSLTAFISGGMVLFTMIPVFLLLATLIKVEELGIRFFGKQRGWRITKDVAQTVVGHASFAWLVSAFCMGIVWSMFYGGMLHQQQFFGPISTYLLAMFLAFLPGLLWFETLVWIGVRKLRYANIPGSERHLADSVGDAHASPDG